MSLQSYVKKLESRLENDQFLTEDLIEFVYKGFTMDDEGIVSCQVGDRLCVLESDQIVVANVKWPGSKRIPY